MLSVAVSSKPGSSGQKDIADALGGGIKENSLVLVEGESDTGKSVLCQYIARNAIETRGKSIAYFTTDHTENSIEFNMKSLAMDISSSIKGHRFLVHEMEPAMDYDGSILGLRAILLETFGLPLWYKYAIIDSPSCYMLRLKTVTQMDFLLHAKEFCINGRSIIIVLNTEVMDTKSLARAHEMSDYYLKLKNEERVTATGQLINHNVKQLEVTKMAGVDHPGRKPIRFEVIPEVGIQVLPLYQVKV
jgi:archaeal flagellar protein FlaH